MNRNRMQTQHNATDRNTTQWITTQHNAMQHNRHNTTDHNTMQGNAKQHNRTHLNTTKQEIKIACTCAKCNVIVELDRKLHGKKWSKNAAGIH